MTITSGFYQETYYEAPLHTSSSHIYYMMGGACYALSESHRAAFCGAIEVDGSGLDGVLFIDTSGFEDGVCFISSTATIPHPSIQGIDASGTVSLVIISDLNGAEVPTQVFTGNQSGVCTTIYSGYDATGSGWYIDPWDSDRVAAMNRDATKCVLVERWVNNEYTSREIRVSFYNPINGNHLFTSQTQVMLGNGYAPYLVASKDLDRVVVYQKYDSGVFLFDGSGNAITSWQLDLHGGTSITDVYCGIDSNGNWIALAYNSHGAGMYIHVYDALSGGALYNTELPVYTPSTCSVGTSGYIFVGSVAYVSGDITWIEYDHELNVIQQGYLSGDERWVYVPHSAASSTSNVVFTFNVVLMGG